MNSHFALVRGRSADVNVALTLAFVLVVAGCSTKTPAPVSDRSTSPPQASAPTTTDSGAAQTPVAARPVETGKTHVVAKGDTLIAIALQYGVDYRELAAWNNIENFNVIRVGDNLRVTAPDASTGQPLQTKSGEAVATPLVSAPAPTPSSTPERAPANSATMKTEPKGGKVPYTDQSLAKLNAEAAAAAPASAAAAASTGASTTASTPAAAAAAGTAAPTAATAASTDDVDWSWPVKGKVIGTFTDASKGIEIAGTRGKPVLAAAAGKVTYAGSAIRGWGQLIIVRHNAKWISAYGHNDKLLFAEGQEVKKGQKIAEMGSTDTDQVKLHFQVRKDGKPVDPLKFLPPQ